MTKPRESLTDEQRDLAAEAWCLVQRYVRWYAARYRVLQLDFNSAVAEQICDRIANFDPQLSSLRTWAHMQARYACQDLLKREGPVNRWGKLRPQSIGDVTDLPGPSPPLPDLDDLDLAEHEVLRGIEARTRRLMADCFGFDVLQADAGLRFGLSRTGVSRLLRVGLAQVRDRLGLDCSGRSPKRRKGA